MCIELETCIIPSTDGYVEYHINKPAKTIIFIIKQFRTGNHEAWRPGGDRQKRPKHNSTTEKNRFHKCMLISRKWQSNGKVTVALLCHRYYKKVTPFRYSLLQKKSNAVPLPLPEKVTPLVTPVTSNAVMPSTAYNPISRNKKGLPTYILRVFCKSIF